MFSYEIVVLSLIKAEKYTVTPQLCVFILHLCPQEIASWTYGVSGSSNVCRAFHPISTQQCCRSLVPRILKVLYHVRLLGLPYSVGQSPLNGSRVEQVQLLPTSEVFQGTEQANNIERLTLNIWQHGSFWQIMEKGYRIQISTSPPHFSGVHPTLRSKEQVVNAGTAVFPRQRGHTLKRVWLLQLFFFFLVPKKDGRLFLHCLWLNLLHWITDVISLAYEAHGLPLPLGIRFFSSVYLK